MASASGLRLHVGEDLRLVAGRTSGPQGGLAQLGQRERLGEATLRQTAPVVQGAHDRAGLLSTEGPRRRHTVAEQAGDHLGSRRICGGRGFDAEEHRGGVRDSEGVQVATALQPGPGAAERGDGAMVSSSIRGGEESPDRRGSEVEQELGRVLDPRGARQVAQEFVVCSNTKTLSGRAFIYRPRRRTVTLDFADAGRSWPRKRQLVAAESQVRVGDVQCGRDLGVLSAGASGVPGRGEPDPCGDVPRAGDNDHGQACENPHGFAGGPVRHLDPEAPEDRGRVASEVDVLAGAGDPQLERGEDAERCPGAARAPESPMSDLAGELTEMGAEGACGAVAGPQELLEPGHPVTDRVRPGCASRLSRPHPPNSRRGLVNRSGRCYVLQQMCSFRGIGDPGARAARV